MNAMNSISRIMIARAALVCAMMVSPALAVSTPGSVELTATINDLGARSGASHDVVVWVTTSSGAFIKTLWKQGDTGTMSATGGDWDHFTTWNTARNGSTAFDGYSSATAASYTATNPSPPAGTTKASNPIHVIWNCKDAGNVVVADGTYHFYIQYAENITSPSKNGPATGALVWTKGPSATSANPADQGTLSSPTGGFNFTNLAITWTPATVAPTITSSAPGGGSQGTAYNHTLTATGSSPISYAVTSGALPAGLTLGAAGSISGMPTTAGLFTGTITASNGTSPNATQSFSINIAQGLVFTSAPPPASGSVMNSYSHTCTVIGTPTVTFSVSSGALPTGLTLSPAGVISGSPSATGVFTGTISASNGLAPNATQGFSIEVSPATPGSVVLTAALGALGSGSDEHWSVVWITKNDGTFVKTLDIRGMEYAGDTSVFWGTHWNDHCPTWYAARNGSIALDGYTAATSATYGTPHNPVTVTWNGRDAANNPMPDGTYKLWIQYAEHIEGTPGPVTTSGLSWTKGTAASTANPANQGSNFTQLSIVWTPDMSYDDWATQAGLSPAENGPMQTPQNDEVTNLEKFAFNMNPSAPDVRMLTVGDNGSAGLPGGALVGGKLRIEFVRRKAATNPGITYTPQFCSSLGIWDDFTGAPVSVTSINGTWERVVVDDPAAGAGTRFGRVKLVQP